MSASLSLAGKTALVTGAATGIGKAIASALAGSGARVVINHPHPPEPAAAVVAEIEAAGGSALAVAADISDRAEFQAMVERLLHAYHRWDVLVNNAAVAVTKPFPQITEEEFDRSFAVNGSASKRTGTMTAEDDFEQVGVGLAGFGVTISKVFGKPALKDANGRSFACLFRDGLACRLIQGTADVRHGGLPSAAPLAASA